jgi:hypothetical protein
MRWLPRAIVDLRMRLFTRINGNEGIAVDVAHFRELYAHPAAGGRSRGAALSDLFWYWLSPGAEVHQEHIENGERYDEVSATTRRILALPRADAERLAAECVTRVLAERRPGLMRLRDLMMPVWAEYYYELVFRERCPRHARDLIVGNANDVVTALKGTGLRHMRRRDRLTRFLLERLGDVPHSLPEGLSVRERALYLQGAFFNTAVVQSSEAMAHLLMALAQHQDVQARLAAGDERYFEHVMHEAFRVYPLFGIAHRITTAEIALDERRIPAGSVLTFNYPEFHRAGYEKAERFDPSRWETLSPHDANFVPFGVAGNRPCPARGLVPLTMRAATREVLRRFELHTGAEHTRSIPNRGPVLLVSRAGGIGARRRGALLAFMRLRDRWEDVWRSLLQLVLGTYMVWDARRLALCRRYFGDR